MCVYLFWMFSLCLLMDSIWLKYFTNLFTFEIILTILNFEAKRHYYCTKVKLLLLLNTGWVKSSDIKSSTTDSDTKKCVFPKTKNTISKSNSLAWIKTLDHIFSISSSRDIIKSLERSKTRSMGNLCIPMRAVKLHASQWRNAIPMRF